MTARIQHNSRYPICRKALRMQDITLVASFTVWAMVLGAAPVLTYHWVFS